MFQEEEEEEEEVFLGFKEGETSTSVSYFVVFGHCRHILGIGVQGLAKISFLGLENFLGKFNQKWSAKAGTRVTTKPGNKTLAQPCR